MCLNASHSSGSPSVTLVSTMTVLLAANWLRNDSGLVLEDHFLYENEDYIDFIVEWKNDWRARREHVAICLDPVRPSWMPLDAWRQTAADII